MKQEDFLAIDVLQKQTEKKQVTDNKMPLNFSQIRCFRFEAEHPNTMFIKHFLNEQYVSVNVGKRGIKLSESSAW